MDPQELVALLTGLFLLSFGLTAYRHFFKILGAAAGLAVWSAFRDPMIRLPGLREHPGTASVLLLIFLCAGGVLLVTRFRRVFVLLGGFGTGVIMAGIAESFFSGGSIVTEPFRIAWLDPMALLAGLVTGVLFLFFERLFAVILTTSLGAYLCSWVVGGRLTFVLCFLFGLALQLYVSARIGKARGDSQKPNDKSGSRDKGAAVLTGLLMIILIPSVSMASWQVERIVASSSRVVMGSGWRDGVRLGEQYAVLDQEDNLVAVITVSKVFSDSAYSEPLTAETARLVKSGMTVQVMERYEYRKAMESGGEIRLQDFLLKYPQSRYRREIIDALDKTRFRMAEMIGTVDSYLNFQRKYPTSRFAPEAMHRAEDMAFKKARATGTEEAFLQFLKRFTETDIISGMTEVRSFFQAKETGLVSAYRGFNTSFPNSPFSAEFSDAIEEFEIWAERLEFGSDPIEAIRYFGQKGDETAVPLLAGKLTVQSQKSEARKAIKRIGKAALPTLLEVLISPLQSLELKDEVALIVGEMGDVSAVPAMRTYVRKENTEAGRKSLLMLEEKAGR